MATSDEKDILDAVAKFVARPITKELSPNGKEISFESFHGKALFLTEALRDLGELEPALGHKAASLRKEIGANLDMIIYAEEGKPDFAALKTAGISFRKLSEKAAELAKYWEEHGARIMERREAIEEIAEKDAKRIIESHPLKDEPEPPTLPKNKTVHLKSSDPVVRMSELMGLLEDGTTNLIKGMTASKIEDLEKATATLKTMSAAFAEMGEVYDRDVTPLAVKHRKNSLPSADGGMGGV